MEYSYWKPNGSLQSPAREDVKDSVESHTARKRSFDKKLMNVFSIWTYDQLRKTSQVTKIKGSSTKLEEWRVDMPDVTGRMMFVVHENVAHFLSFFIKKSSQGNATKKSDIETAEKRAKEFWSENRN